MSLTKTLGPVALVLLASLGPLAACSTDDGEATPSRPPIPPVPTTPIGTDGGPGADGGGTRDCFDSTKEKPTEPSQFLNQCNDGECFGFDNAARIEGYTPGVLPPLT
jgi:hypothetical protein